MKAWNPNIRVQREAFDIGEETRRITAGRTDIGGVVAFTGWCRDEGGRRLPDEGRKGLRAAGER